MAKKKPTNLARGSKLASQHISNNLNTAQELFTEKLDRQNLKQTKTPFFLNYHFHGFDYPVMGLTETEIKNGINGDLVFAIPLPPTQDYFSPNGVINKNQPLIQLDSISISMDLRAEGAAMNAPYPIVVPPTLRSKGHKINYEKAAEQDIQFSILEKEYTYFSEGSFYPRSSLFSTTIPATIAFQGTVKVENPYFLPNINKQLNPYKAYYLAFHFPNQKDIQFYVSNLTVSMKCYSELDLRNENIDNTGNKSLYNAETSLQSYNLNLQPPVGNQTIWGDGDPTGIQPNLEKIDEAVLEKMTAGMDKYGNNAWFEDLNGQAIKTFAAYDVLIVPMWAASYGKSGAIATWNGTDSDVLWGNIDPQYYDPATAEGFQGPIQDIRTIALNFPFTVHHVFAYHNNQFRNENFTLQNMGNGGAGNCFSRVGVGLGTCFQSDKYTYEEVAYVEYDGTFSTNIVDEIRINNSTYNQGATTKTLGWLVQVPITYATPGPGTGFYGQNQPVYCGGSTWRQKSRTGNPDTEGMEQFLEVRWEFQMDDGPWVENPEGIPALEPSLLAGFGGHFVYIVGKKTLTTNRNTLKE